MNDCQRIITESIYIARVKSVNSSLFRPVEMQKYYTLGQEKCQNVIIPKLNYFSYKICAEVTQKKQYKVIQRAFSLCFMFVTTI